MRFGLVGLGPSLAASVELAVQAERDGFDSVFWGDHWMGLFPPSVSGGRDEAGTDRWYHPAVLAALVAERTTSVTIGVGVTDVIRHHPVDLAHAWLTLAEAFPDRDFVLGLGLGEAENLAPYGLEPDTRVQRMAEGAHVIRQLLDGSDEQYDGSFFRLCRPVMEPRVTAPRVRVWMAAHGPKSLHACATVADGWYPLLLRPASYARALAGIRNDAAEAGRDASAIVAGMAMNIIVADSEEDAALICAHPIVRAFALWSSSGTFARHGVQHPLGAAAVGFKDYIPSRLGSDAFRSAVDAVPPEVVRGIAVVGTVEHIGSVIDEYAGAGAQHVVLWDLTRLMGRPGREAEIIHRVKEHQ